MNKATDRMFDKTSDRMLHTGNTIPVIGLGTWKLTRDTADAIRTALQVGYRLIDTSGDYGTQEGIGEGIRRSGLARPDFYLTTKVEETDDAYEALGRSLDELGLDHADLVLIHRPPQDGVGEILWQGLIRARENGLAVDIGVSNYSAAAIDALAEATGVVPVVNQIEWSPFGHSEDMLRHAEENAIVLQAYSPLTRMTRLDDPTLATIAERYDKTPAQILLRWDVQHGVVPLPKAGSREHLEENLDIFDIRLAKADMQRLDGLNERYSALGKLPYD
ncbi:MAG: aldo/keto reductase [Aquamicrobium sp.]|uniref:aldo/keto reductase n=1 Tax=Aquamicrobium sp. TaxID=1872579 RepID=UPI00349E5979|nr:aldo/keto reductase [Aquamicrobium sp.]